MKRSDNNYSQLRTLKELRVERERIAWQKEAALHKIEMSVERIKNIFSFEHLLLIVNEKLAMVRSFVSGAHNIIDYIVSLFRRKKSKPAEQPIPDEQPKVEQQASTPQQPLTE